MDCNKGAGDWLLMDTSSNPGNQSNFNGYSDVEESIRRMKDEWQKKRRWWQRQGKFFPTQEEARALWRVHLGEFLESMPVHMAVLVLLLVDLLATAVDMLKTLHNKSRDLNHCAALVESCHCVSHFERSASLEFLYWVGIAILSLLLLNVGGLLLAFGVSFFRHPGYVLDLLVLTTALCLEIFLDAQTAGLLVILNLWRIVRVAHGIFEVTDEAMESQIHRIESQLQALEAKNKEMQLLLVDKDHKIAQLQQGKETR